MGITTPLSKTKSRFDPKESEISISYTFAQPKFGEFKRVLQGLLNYHLKPEVHFDLKASEITMETFFSNLIIIISKIYHN